MRTTPTQRALKDLLEKGEERLVLIKLGYDDKLIKLLFSYFSSSQRFTIGIMI